MTALPLPRPLPRQTRRLCVGLMLGGLLLYTVAGWAWLAPGVTLENDAFILPVLLGITLMFGPYLLMLKRFQPLPDADQQVDERQAQRHALAHKRAFYIGWGVVLVLAHVTWVAFMRGIPVLPSHVLGPMLPIAWLGFMGMLPSMVFAWTEPDYREDA